MAKDECAERGLHLNPNTVHLDFEEAAHLAFKAAFPSIKIQGCNFHLKKAWLRKCGEVGLQNEYEDKKSPVYNWVKTLFGMPFLNAHEVIEATCFAPNDPKV